MHRSLSQRVGNAVRLAEVIQVLVRHGFADLVQRTGLHEGLPARVLRRLRLIKAPSGEPETLGNRMCAVFTELGPTFIKFGQILSTRPDIVPPDVREALGRLQDRVAALPFDEMAAMVVQELGAPPHELFASLDETPVASASLAQVYQATLPNGAQVAVKIQRPGIETVIRSDLRLMRRIAEWIQEHVSDALWMNPVEVLDEFERSIRRELDFIVEAHTIERFRINFANDPRVFVPRTYSELSSSRVLTMSWIDGIRVDNLDAYPDQQCDPATVALVGCDVLCRQVFHHHLFHADPHPGNIRVLSHNRVAFLDYGMVGHLERNDVAAIADALRAVFHGDAEECVRAALRFTRTGDVPDRDRLVHEIADFIAFEAPTVVAGGKVARAVEQLAETLRRNHLELAPRFSLLLKALATIESTGYSLDPSLDMAAVIKPFIDEIIANRYKPFQILDDIRSDLSSFARLANQFPEDILQLSRMLRMGQLKIQLNHEKLNHLAEVTDRASNRLTVGVITGAVIVGSSLLISAKVGPHNLGLAGYLIAAVLGLALVISILRSRVY